MNKYRFYYSLSRPVGPTIASTPKYNEFGINMSKSLGSGLYAFDPYYPINNDKGIHWLVEQLTGRSFGESPENDYDTWLLRLVWLNWFHKDQAYIDIISNDGQVPEKPKYNDINADIQDEFAEIKSDLGNAIWSIYEDTCVYYGSLLAIYEEEYDNLLDQVSSTTTTTSNADTRFNDTPQNTPVDDGYAADNYTTNITKSTGGSTITTVSDNATVMGRLAEIQEKFKNIISDWAEKFNVLIVGE